MRHPPLEITADDLTAEDVRHWMAHGYVKRPGDFACNAGYGTGDGLRRAIGELALRGLTAKPRLKLRLDGQLEAVGE